jgi:hypothetical protein
MAFLRVSGLPNVQMFVKTASTALDANGFVKLSSGQLVASTNDDVNALGLCMETIKSTDGDYATARPVAVDMVDGEDVLLGDVSGTALATTSVGLFFDFADDLHADGAEGSAFTGGASGTAGPLLCIGFISTTQGYFVLASSYLNAQVNPTS